MPEELQQFKKYILITKKGIDIFSGYFFWSGMLQENAVS